MQDLGRQDLESWEFQQSQKCDHWVSDTRNVRTGKALTLRRTNLLRFGRKDSGLDKENTCSRSQGQLVEAPRLAETR